MLKGMDGGRHWLMRLWLRMRMSWIESILQVVKLIYTFILDLCVCVHCVCALCVYALMCVYTVCVRAVCVCTVCVCLVCVCVYIFFNYGQAALNPEQFAVGPYNWHYKSHFTLICNNREKHKESKEEVGREKEEKQRLKVKAAVAFQTAD